MGTSPAEWLVAPMVAIEEERAAALLRERFGIEGTLEELGSNHDRNFRVRTDPNDHGYVFKVFNPVIDRAVLRAQSQATEHLARALPELRLPRARVGVDGEHIQTVSVDGQDYDCQLLDYVPGEPIMDSRYLAPRVVARLGELAGRVTAALEGLDVPTPHRPMLWDLRNALEVVEALAPHMVDQRRAERAAGRPRGTATGGAARSPASHTGDSRRCGRQQRGVPDRPGRPPHAGRADRLRRSHTQLGRGRAGGRLHIRPASSRGHTGFGAARGPRVPRRTAARRRRTGRAVAACRAARLCAGGMRAARRAAGPR